MFYIFIKGKDYYSFPTIDALAGIKNVLDDKEDEKNDLVATKKAKKSKNDTKLQINKDTKNAGKNHNEIDGVERNIEMELRQLGFGYRAKFIHRVAQTISERDEGVEWLFALRQLPYQDAHSGNCSFCYLFLRERKHIQCSWDFL